MLICVFLHNMHMNRFPLKAFITGVSEIVINLKISIILSVINFIV